MRSSRNAMHCMSYNICGIAVRSITVQAVRPLKR